MPFRRFTWPPLARLEKEMDEFFRPFVGGPLEEYFKEPPAKWVPFVDVEETDKEIMVKVDLPGVDPKDVQISVVNGILVVRGEKKEEKEEKEKNYHRVERFTGHFYREVPLPVGTDPDKIVATSNKGVISIAIPKKPEVLPKKIAVKPTEN
jgi:HSP20 family protein